MWYAIELKERYGKETSRKEFYNRLKEHYHKCSKDIFISLGSKELGINYYVFLRDEDMNKLWNALKSDKFINEDFGYKNITDEELENLVAEFEFIRDDISFGDIVRINGGKYNKLIGIVLRERGESVYEIGLKFCYGIRFDIKKGNELEILGNIFNYIKVKK